MNTKIMFWVRTPRDTRDTASSTGSMDVPDGISAVQYAKGIDSGDIKDRPAGLPEDYRIARYHGVTIKYPSGRTRTVHAD